MQVTFQLQHVKGPVHKSNSDLSFVNKRQMIRPVADIVKSATANLFHFSFYVAGCGFHVQIATTKKVTSLKAGTEGIRIFRLLLQDHK